MHQPRHDANRPRDDGARRGKDAPTPRGAAPQRPFRRSRLTGTKVTDVMLAVQADHWLEEHGDRASDEGRDVVERAPDGVATFHQEERR